MKLKTILPLLVLGLASANVGAVPISSSASPALAGSTLIDFEGIAIGDYPSLSLPGVTIVGNGGPMTICDGCGGGGGSYGDVGRSLQNTSGSPTNFDLIFTDTVSAFGILGGALNGGWTYTAYDSSNNVLETLSITSPCCSGYFWGIAQNGIARVNLNGFGDWVVFDNLRFVSTPRTSVPEPMTLAAFGLGLLGLAGARRRKV